MYSDYEYTLYNNEMCRDQIRTLLGDEAVKLYDSLNSYSFRADLARYCILYQQGGFYFDSVICPEFKLEFGDFPVMYRPPIGACGEYNAIENGVMYFNRPHHEFLWDAITLSFKNVKEQYYGVTPLDITSPVMLGRLLNTYDIQFGQSRFLDEEEQTVYGTNKAAYFQDVMHWLYKPNDYVLETFKCVGTNSYGQMWSERRMYKPGKFKFVSFYTVEYEHHAEQLKNSMIKLGIDASGVEYRERRGSWSINSHIKAEIILEHLLKNDAVVWTDADSIILRPPTFFDTVTTDVAVFYLPKEYAEGWLPPPHSILKNPDRFLQTGTMYFKNNPRVIKLIESWIDLNKKDSQQWDQWTMQVALENSDVSITQLPAEYISAEFIARAAKKMKDRKYSKTVILHTQAGDKLRNLIV
jgi:hypothetical protein